MMERRKMRNIKALLLCITGVAVLATIGTMEYGNKNFASDFRTPNESTAAPYKNNKISNPAEHRPRKCLAFDEETKKEYEEMGIKIDYNVPQKTTEQKTIIIVSEWRSGSGFLFDTLDSHGEMISFYEPFSKTTDLSTKKLRIWEDVPEAMILIKNILLNRRFPSSYFFGSFFFMRTLVGKMCLEQKMTRQACYDLICESLPITLIKFVRISLSLMEDLLLDDEINKNLHVIYLVRDPRSVMVSRWNQIKSPFCKNECSDVVIHCEDIARDLATLQNFRVKFPGKFHWVRFEDLALNPLISAEQLFNEVQLELNDNVKKSIEYRAQTDIYDLRNTVRVSSKRVMPWTKEADWETVNKIQNACKSVMVTLGYETIDSMNNLTIQDVLKPHNLFI